MKLSSPLQIPTEEDLREARSAAVDADLLADGLEARARSARRKAASKMRHYEDMLHIFQGQLTLDIDPEEGP